MFVVEFGPCSRNNLLEHPTRLAIAEKLRNLADDMDEIASLISIHCDSAEWDVHGREIAGAGNIARQWAEQIERES